jgi:hypothetical protein
MANRQQLESALRNADAAGDTDAARQLARALRSGQYDQSGPQERQAVTQSRQPTTEPNEQIIQAGQEQPNFAERAFRELSEMITGEQRTGRDIERTPSLFQGDFLADLPASEQAKIVGLAQITSDPNELAQIVAQQVPGTQVQYNRDEQGNVYPVLRREDGRAAMVDKPGIDLLNVGQVAADMAMFTPAGRVGGVVGGTVAAAGAEAARQAVQASTGGEFDETDVALAGGIETAGRAIQGVAGTASRALAGQPTDEAADIIRAGEQFNVPVMTSDVVPPRTAAGRAGQVISETVPVVGTGGLRAAQQDAREQAVDQFVDRFQGGSYESIVQSLKSQRDRIKTAAGKTYDNLVPKLNSASEQAGGIGFTKTERAIQEASEIFTRPGRKTSDKAADILVDIQETIGGPGQTFQNVKSNLGAWQEAIESVDPSIRSQLTSEDKAQIQKVLRAIRQDRDDFARSVLTENEYRQLKNADSAYGEMANTMKRSRIKNVLDKGDMTPEVARNLLFSNKPSEIRKLYQGLTNEGRENARATIITEIADRLSRRASGLTPDALATELGRQKEALDVFFRGERRRELNGFLRLLNATRRAQKAEGTFSVPTGQQAIPYIVGAGSVIEPSVAAAYATIGGLGRLYESPRARSILARMASAEPGSTQFDQLAARFREEATRIAQAARNQKAPENLTGEDNEPNPNQ